MSDTEAFLQAIVDRPDDDHLRLIYADWLEERGDPHGEFIRLQVALVDPALNGARQVELLARQVELLAMHQPHWLGPLQALPITAEFRRGFLHKVRLDAKAFLDHAATLFQTATLQAVQLRNAARHLRPLARCPHLAQLSRLDLSENDLGDAGIQILADCPYLASLQELVLDANLIGIAGARALAGSRHLPGLEALSLSHNPIEALGLHALLHSAHGGRLQTLRVAHCDINSTGAGYVSQAALERLTVLDLSRNHIGHQGTAALTRSARTSALTTLVLDDTGCDCRGARNLAATPFLGQLQTLSLRRNHVSGFGAEVLATSPYLPVLTEVDLRNNHIPLASRQKLRKRFGERVYLDDRHTE